MTLDFAAYPEPVTYIYPICPAERRTECVSARRTHSALCLPTNVLLGALVVRVELGLALCELQEAAARRHTRMGTEL